MLVDDVPCIHLHCTRSVQYASVMFYRNRFITNNSFSY